MNQTAGHVETETEKPKNQKHNKNCPKHICFSLSTHLCILKSCFFAQLAVSKRLAAFQTNWSGSRRNETAERAHSLRSELWSRRLTNRDQLCEQISEDGNLLTKTIAKRHRFTSALSATRGMISSQINHPVNREPSSISASQPWQVRGWDAVQDCSQSNGTSTRMVKLGELRFLTGRRVCEGCVRSRTPVPRCGSQRRQQAVVATEQWILRLVADRSDAASVSFFVPSSVCQGRGVGSISEEEPLARPLFFY